MEPRDVWLEIVKERLTFAASRNMGDNSISIAEAVAFRYGLCLALERGISWLHFKGEEIVSENEKQKKQSAKFYC